MSDGEQFDRLVSSRKVGSIRSPPLSGTLRSHRLPRRPQELLFLDTLPNIAREPVLVPASPHPEPPENPRSQLSSHVRCTCLRASSVVSVPDTARVQGAGSPNSGLSSHQFVWWILVRWLYVRSSSPLLLMRRWESLPPRAGCHPKELSAAVKRLIQQPRCREGLMVSEPTLRMIVPKRLGSH